MIDPAFFEQLKRFGYLIRNRINTIYSGGRKSIRTGKGIEVVDYREYYPGDDIRDIDWKIYGRTEKLHIRQFEEEKSLTTHILVDSSKSMDFASGKIKKFDYAAMIGLGFAYLVANENEKFGLATYSEALRDVIPPKRTKTHFFKAVNIINNATLSGMTDLAQSSGSYIKMIKSRSFIVLVSDFLEPRQSIAEGIFRLSRKASDFIVVQVLDQGEIDLMSAGDVKLHDLETGEIKRIYITPGFRDKYKKNLEDHIAFVKESCKDVGAHFFIARTSVPVFDNFVRIIGQARLL